MANPHKGEIAFEAGGKSYVLQFSIDAICQLENETGQGIVALVGDLQNPLKMSLTLSRLILWAGLREHHAEISVKDAGELIPAAGGLAGVARLVGAALRASFPEIEGNSPPPRKAGNPRRNGIGPRFSEHGVPSGEKTKVSGAKPPGKSP